MIYGGAQKNIGPAGLGFAIVKKDMLNQMKNVREIPASSAGVNSAKVEQKYEDEVFDALKGSDGDIEDLFGG